jgi:hypothetical protein
MAKNRVIVQPKATVARTSDGLYADVRQLIVNAREQTAQAVNAALTMTYWHTGDRVHREILKSKRAGYGDEIVSALGRQLSWTHFKAIIYLKDPPPSSSARPNVGQSRSVKIRLQFCS